MGYFIILLFVVLLPFPVTANDESRGFSFTFENDVFRDTDRSYTNGVRFSWIGAEEDLPIFIEPFADYLLNPTADLFPLFPKDGKRRVSYALGQSMFTPDDIATNRLLPNDRPYAGWLYGSMGLTSDNGEHLDYIEVTLGMVGSASLAEQTQDFVHKHITGSPIAQGWDDHQLDNEPGIIIMYEHKWRNLYEARPYGFGADLTPHAGISLGNIFTHAAIGGTVRVGYDLPADYGPPRVRPSIAGTDYFVPHRGLGAYLFSGVEGRAVGRNIFLDGNTFSDSHSVDKEYFIGDLQFGAAITYKSVRIAYTEVFRTEEYEEQGTGDRFGAITISVRF